MTPDVRYKSDDDLRDTSVMEKQESEGDITGAATRQLFQGIREGSKPVDMTQTSRDSTLTAILGPHGHREQTRSHLGRNDALRLTLG